MKIKSNLQVNTKKESEFKNNFTPFVHSEPEPASRAK